MRRAEKRAIQSSGAQTVGFSAETIRVSIKPVLKVQLPNLIVGGKTLRRERDRLSLGVLAGIEQAQSVEPIFPATPSGGRPSTRSEWCGGQGITAQPLALQRERKDVDVRRQQMKAHVFLANAHGGGWRSAQGPSQRELTVDAHDTGGG